MGLDIKSLIIGAGIFALFAFTAQDILTFKPAQPKSVIAVPCVPGNAIKYILSYTKQGYIVKSYTAGARYDYDGLLVMEKY